MLEGNRKKRFDGKIIREDTEGIISLDSEEYQENRRVKKENAKKYIGYFGRDVIIAVDPDNSFSLGGTLISIRRKLAQLTRSNYGMAQSEIRAFMQDGAQHSPEVATHKFVQEVTRGMPGHPQAGEWMAKVVDHIPDEVLIDIIKVHKGQFEKDRERFDRLLPELIAEFTEKLDRLFKDPQHPLDVNMISPERIQKRIDSVAIEIADPLEMFWRTDVAIGEYSHENNYAALQFDRATFGSSRGRLYRYTLWHEMNHVLSGRTVEKRRRNIHATRIGLRRWDKEVNRWRYEWANEAMTEFLTGDMWFGRREYRKGAYIPERDLQRRLFRRLPEKLFLAAYMEDTDPTQSDLGMPAWAELQHEATKKYGEDFLEAIDDAVRERGAGQVAKEFDSYSGKWNNPTMY